MPDYADEQLPHMTSGRLRGAAESIDEYMSVLLERSGGAHQVASPTSTHAVRRRGHRHRLRAERTAGGHRPQLRLGAGHLHERMKEAFAKQQPARPRAAQARSWRPLPFDREHFSFMRNTPERETFEMESASKAGMLDEARAIDAGDGLPGTLIKAMEELRRFKRRRARTVAGPQAVELLAKAFRASRSFRRRRAELPGGSGRLTRAFGTDGDAGHGGTSSKIVNRPAQAQQGSDSPPRTGGLCEAHARR